MENKTTMYVSSDTSGLNVGSSTGSNCYFPYDDWRWDRYYPVYYPVYKEVNDNRYEVAFKIMKVFLKNGYFKKITIEKHNKMIEDIVKELN